MPFLLRKCFLLVIVVCGNMVLLFFQVTKLQEELIETPVSSAGEDDDVRKTIRFFIIYIAIFILC